MNEKLNRQGFKTHANNVLLWLWINAVFRECNSTAELTLNGCGVVQYRRRHQNCNWKNVRCSTILQYFFKSRSWRHFYAVIRERLAENCRGRITTIICTRTNAPKYILESHRLHFGSICDQNGRNFEPCISVIKTFYIIFFICVCIYFVIKQLTKHLYVIYLFMLFYLFLLLLLLYILNIHIHKCTYIKNENNILPHVCIFFVLYKNTWNNINFIQMLYVNATVTTLLLL